MIETHNLSERELLVGEPPVRTNSSCCSSGTMVGIVAAKHAIFSASYRPSRPACADPNGGCGSDCRRHNRAGMLRKARAFVPRQAASQCPARPAGSTLLQLMGEGSD